MNVQPELFRKFPTSENVDNFVDPAFEGLPADIKQAFGVLDRGAYGASDMTGPSFYDAGATSPLGSPLGVPQSPAAGGGQNGPPNFQQRFIHSKSPIKTRGIVEEARVHVFDLALEKDAREYEEVMRTVYPKVLAEGGVGNGGSWIWKATPPVTVIDPHAPRGFRVIVTLEYARTEVKQGHDSSEMEFGVVDHQGKVRSTTTAPAPATTASKAP